MGNKSYVRDIQVEVVRGNPMVLDLQPQLANKLEFWEIHFKSQSYINKQVNDAASIQGKTVSLLLWKKIYWWTQWIWSFWLESKSNSRIFFWNANVQMLQLPVCIIFYCPLFKKDIQHNVFGVACSFLICLLTCLLIRWYIGHLATFSRMKGFQNQIIMIVLKVSKSITFAPKFYKSAKKWNLCKVWTCESGIHILPALAILKLTELWGKLWNNVHVQIKAINEKSFSLYISKESMSHNEVVPFPLNILNFMLTLVLFILRIIYLTIIIKISYWLALTKIC